jgi:PAS domain S-box-containing protein
MNSARTEPPRPDSPAIGGVAHADAELFALALRGGGVGTLDVDLHALVARRGGIGATAFGLTNQAPLPHAEWLKLLFPEDRESVSAAFETMLRTGARYDVDYRIRRPTDGELRWIAVRAEPLMDANGTPYRLVGIVQDVTAQKLAELALRESEARLKLAQRAARIGSFDWLVDTEFMKVSEEYVAILGLPAGTIEESHAEMMRRVHPEDRDRVTAEIAGMLRGDAHAIEYRIIRDGDGAVRTLASQAELYPDGRGRGLRVIGTIRDVTERRSIEAELRQLNEDLERRVTAEVAGREAAQLQLAQSQRIEAIGQLTGGIAHDFNNMIQGVIGAIDLASRRIAAVRLVRDFARPDSCIIRMYLAFTGCNSFEKLLFNWTRLYGRL